MQILRLKSAFDVFLLQQVEPEPSSWGSCEGLEALLFPDVHPAFMAGLEASFSFMFFFDLLMDPPAGSLLIGNHLSGFFEMFLNSKWILTSGTFSNQIIWSEKMKKKN